ncbi:MAG: hypothetical protein N2595_03965 [bacterium]|nr:hypothetical protein [bacterium]
MKQRVLKQFVKFLQDGVAHRLLLTIRAAFLTVPERALLVKASPMLAIVVGFCRGRMRRILGADLRCLTSLQYRLVNDVILTLALGPE